MFVELGVVEQRHKAVLEVLDGANVTDVAALYGVSRKTVHKWLRRYAAEGLKGLADKSTRRQAQGADLRDAFLGVGSPLQNRRSGTRRHPLPRREPV